MWTKKCGHCGQEFEAEFSASAYCCEECCRKERNKRAREKNLASHIWRCRHCFRTFYRKTSSVKWCKHPACQQDKKEYWQEYRRLYQRQKLYDEKKFIRQTKHNCQRCGKPIWVYVDSKGIVHENRMFCHDCQMKNEDNTERMDGEFLYIIPESATEMKKIADDLIERYGIEESIYMSLEWTFR